MSGKIHLHDTFFSIHDFIPSLVEPKTLCSNVEKCVPSLFYRKAKLWHENSSVSWEKGAWLGLLPDPYLVYSRNLQAVWHSSPQTYWADKPPANLVKIHIVLLQVGWSPSFYISNQLLQVIRSLWSGRNSQGLDQGETLIGHPLGSIPKSPHKISTAGFILAYKLQKQWESKR